MNQESSPGLIRALGPWTATAIVVGTVIGAGIFKKPISIAEAVPSVQMTLWLWVIGGILTFFGAVALAEVAVLFPRAGGNYVFLREGYGRLMGFLWGWVEFWMIRAGSLAALATIFTESLHDILKQTVSETPGAPVMGFWQERGLTIAVLIALAWVNIRGVRWGGGLQLFITLVKVFSLLAIVVLPFVLWGKLETHQPTSAAPPFTLGGLGTAFLGILWAYHGWMNIAPIAGEVKEPQRNLPLAFLLGTGLVMALYVGANVAYHLVIPQGEMAKLVGTTVAAEFGLRLIGPVGTLAAATAVMISVFGALNGNILVGPRVLYAMGEDRLAPHQLTRIHPSYHTPANAINLLTGWTVLLILAAALVMQAGYQVSLFDLLTNYAMFGAIIFETLAVTTIFVFRRTLPDAPRPYRCIGYPWTPLVYLIVPIYVLITMFFNQWLEAIIGSGFIALGAIVYFLWLRDAKS